MGVHWSASRPVRFIAFEIRNACGVGYADPISDTDGADKEHISPLRGVEPLFLGLPAGSFVTVWTELSRRPNAYCKEWLELILRVE
jgi:hypothetical protein